MDILKRIKQEGREFVRETLAGIVSETITKGKPPGMAGDWISSKREESAKLKALRPRLLAMIYNLPDDEARENLLNHYRKICQQDLKGKGKGENWFVTMLACALDLESESDQKEFLTKIGRATSDQDRINLLDFMDHNPWRQSFQWAGRKIRYWVKDYRTPDAELELFVQRLNARRDRLKQWVEEREARRVRARTTGGEYHGR